MDPTQFVIDRFKAEARRIFGVRLREVVLFGSHARGTATPESDVDLLLVLEGTVEPGREIDRVIDVLTDLNLEHGVLLSVVPVSASAYENAQMPLLLNVRHEGVLA